MKRVLIADANKASLVLTSEVFKDYFPGIQVLVAKTSADALELVKSNNNLDAIVIDFDLPDRDGAETAARIKKLVQTPVLITGFNREDVHDAIAEELSAYDDCLSWVEKPVRAELVVEIVKRYCEGKYRTQRRVSCSIPILFELDIRVPEPVGKVMPKVAVKTLKDSKAAKAAKSGKVTTKEAPLKLTQRKMLIPGELVDCSIGGTKLKISKENLKLLTLAEPAMAAVGCLQEGIQLHLQLPPWDNVANGEPLSFKELLLRMRPSAASLAKSKAAAGKAAAGKSPAGKPPAKTEASLNPLKVKIAWGRAEQSDTVWYFGLQSENPQTSKRLFDSVVSKAE